MAPVAILAGAGGDDRNVRELQAQLLDQVDGGVLPPQVRMPDRAVVAAALARDGLDLQRQLRAAAVVVGHAVQVPRHLVRDVSARVALAGIDEVVAGGEPVRIEDQHDVRLHGIDPGAQPRVARDEVGIRARALQHAKLLALHQPGVVRHDGRADDLSHDVVPL